MTNATTSGVLRQNFPQTHWSVVLSAREEASPQAEEALEILCRAYWYPIYSYVRRCGQSPPDAQDITQEFFCRLLEKNWLSSADREKGRLRTFLIVALKRFMAKEWRRASAQRRGGGQIHIPIDTAFAETRYAAETVVLPPDDSFDQQWALTLIDLTIRRLQEEFEAVGKARAFEALKEFLTAARGEIDYASVAKRLETSEGAARVAVHRLRKRFREIYREEISRTLSDDTDLDAELRHLGEAVTRT